jgi:hypothetical protein
MNATPPGNYATVSRNSPAYFPPRFLWVEKSQTLSDEFGKKYRPLIRVADSQISAALAR